MNPNDRQILREQVRFFYDLQRLRIQARGRAQPTADPVILHPTDRQDLLVRSTVVETLERQILQDITQLLMRIPFYVNTLSNREDYRGLGPTMAAVILSEFDVTLAKYPSQFWSFAGLAPTDCKRCKDCHQIVVSVEGKWKHPKNIKGAKCDKALEEVELRQLYDSSKTMKPTKGQKLPYNSFLRTKLIGVLGPNLIKCNSPWRRLYDEKKLYYQSKGWGISDGHRHNAAMRFMIKMLLLDIWTKWRTAEGLPLAKSYHEGKLGHVHTDSTPIPQSHPKDESVPI